MERFFFETDEALAEAVAQLRCLGRHARKLLAECVATQGITRTAASKAAEALESAGFVFLRDTGNLFEPKIVITPSLSGEEALEALEEEVGEISVAKGVS